MTKWIEENWWFSCGKDAEDAKVNAFRAWLRGEKTEGFVNGIWVDRLWDNPNSISFHKDYKWRPCHPHRALIDQYEPGQEWEIAAHDSDIFGDLDDEPAFDPDCRYRLKQSAPVVDWPAMPAWSEWVAMDANGEWWHYAEEPSLSDSRYGLESGGCSGDIHLAFAPKFTGDWKQSKVRRPR